jgi:uncharacterized protein YuzE
VVYLRLRTAAVTSTGKIAPGVLMDLADDGRPVGFEILDASQSFDGPSQGVTFELLSRVRTALK